VTAFSQSSRHLVNRVVSKIDPEKTSNIIEYGAGDGVVTKQVLKSIKKPCKVFAFEPNENFYSELRSIDDKRLFVINDVAQNTHKYMNGTKADLVLASMPFSWIKNKSTLIKNMHDRLEKDGKFIIYHQYFPIGLIKPLSKHFNKVKIEYELKNFLPCFIITCEK